MATSRKRKSENQSTELSFPLDKLPTSILFLITKKNYMQNFQLFSQVSKKYYHLVHSRDYWLPLIKEQFPFVGVDTYISRPDCDWAHIFRSLELTYYGTFSHKTALLFYYTKRNDLRSIKLLNVTLDMLREEDSYGMKAAQYAMLAGHQNILDYFYQTLILQLTDIPGSIQHNFMQLYHAIYCRQPIDKIKALFQQQIDLHHPDDYATLLGEQRQLYKAAMTQSDTKVFLWLQHSSTPFTLDLYEDCFNEAAKLGNAEFAKLLINLHPNQFVPLSAMVKAAALGHAAFLRSVLTRQPAISFHTLLNEAALAGHVDCVNVICELAPSEALSDKLFFIHPLKSAIINGHLRCAEVLFASDSSLLERLKEDAGSFLGQTAHGGHVGVIKWLYELGIDLEQPLSDRHDYPMNIFSIAAYVGHIHLLEFLLMAGFDPKNAEPHSPLYYSAINKQVECAKLLLTSKDIKNIHAETFYKIVEMNNVVLLQICLEQGINLNLTNGFGFTPLMMAASTKAVHAVQFLLDNKVNIEAINNNGHTALALAIIDEACTVIELLLIHGARLTYCDAHHQSILELAIDSGNEVVVSLLLKYSAVNVVKSEKPSALAKAVNHPNILALLLNHGAMVNAVIPGDDITILMYALRHNKFSAAKLLIESGADMRYVNAHQQSVLSYILRYANSVEILALLVKKYQVNLEQNLPDGMPPIFYVAAFAQYGIVSYFLKMGFSPTKAYQFDKKTLTQFAALTNNTTTQEALQNLMAKQDSEVIHLSPMQIAELFDCKVSIAAFDYHIRHAVSHNVMKLRW